MNASFGSWPFWPWPSFAPTQLSQSILPDWSLQRIEVNYAGDLGVEKEVVGKVASYGKQLGILTEAVLMLAGDKPKAGEDPLTRLREVAEKIEAVKQETKQSVTEKAREAMSQLAELDRAAAERLAADYAKKK